MAGRAAGYIGVYNESAGAASNGEDSSNSWMAIILDNIAANNVGSGVGGACIAAPRDYIGWIDADEESLIIDVAAVVLRVLIAV
jgi:hypothetical protein